MSNKKENNIFIGTQANSELLNIINLLCNKSGNSLTFIINTNFEFIFFDQKIKDFFTKLNIQIEINKEVPSEFLQLINIEKDDLRNKIKYEESYHHKISLYDKKLILTIEINKIKDKDSILYAFYIEELSTQEKNLFVRDLRLRLTSILSNTTNINYLFPEVYKIIKEIYELDEFYITRYNTKTEKIYFQFIRGQKLARNKVSDNEFKNSLLNHIQKNGTSLYLNASEIKEFKTKNNLHSLIDNTYSWMGATTKISKDKSLALVALNHTKRYTYNQNDFELFKNITQRVGITYSNKQNEIHLVQKQEKNNFILNTAHIISWEYSKKKDSVIIHNHSDYIPKLKYEREFFNFFIQKDSTKIKREFTKLIENEKRTVNINLQLKPDAKMNSQYIKFVGVRFYDRFRKENTIIGSFQDITELKINEIKLLKAKRKAAESDQLKSSFLANMSHEIRTPLNGILGFSKLMAEENISAEKKKQYIKYIDESGQNLLQLINDLLDIAKIESGKFNIKIKNLNLNQLLNQEYHFFKNQIIDKKGSAVEFVVDIDKKFEKQELFIKTDPLRLKQVLNNLISNAIKFTENGYIKFGYQLDTQNKRINFYVEDSGIGIPNCKQNILFSRFGKIENGQIINPGGTGLGLSIVKQIITLLGGKIDVLSKENKGSLFQFYLPYEKGEKVVLNTKKNYEEIKDFNLKAKILLVEDNLINQHLTVDSLKTLNKNIKIDIAGNGKVALEILKKNNYDLILMDIQMPIMDGYETTKIIRNEFDAPKNQIPIIGLSAHALKREKDKCLNLGMNVYLTKPFKPEEILNQISHFVLSKEMEIKNPKKITDKKMKTLNLQTLKEMYDSDMNSIKSILKLYAEQIPNQIKMVNELLLNEDWENAKINAHSLKGTLSYLGNEELRQKALEIETIAKTTRDKTEALSKFKELSNIWGLIFEEIKNILK